MIPFLLYLSMITNVYAESEREAEPQIQGSSPPIHNHPDTTTIELNGDQSSHYTGLNHANLASSTAPAVPVGYAQSNEQQLYWLPDNSDHHHHLENQQPHHQQVSSVVVNPPGSIVSSATVDETNQPVHYVDAPSLQAQYPAQWAYPGVQEIQPPFGVSTAGQAIGGLYPSLSSSFAGTIYDTFTAPSYQYDEAATVEPMDTSPSTPTRGSSDDELLLSDDRMSLVADESSVEAMEDVTGPTSDFDCAEDDCMTDVSHLLSDTIISDETPMPGLVLDSAAREDKDLHQNTNRAWHYPLSCRSSLLSPLPWSAPRNDFYISPFASPLLSSSLSAPISTPNEGSSFTHAHRSGGNVDIVPNWQALQGTSLGLFLNDQIIDCNSSNTPGALIMTPSHEDEDIVMTDMDRAAQGSPAIYSLQLLPQGPESAPIPGKPAVPTKETAVSDDEEKEATQQSPKTNAAVLVSSGTQTNPTPREKVAHKATQVEPDQSDFKSLLAASETTGVGSEPVAKSNRQKAQEETVVLSHKNQGAVSRGTDTEALSGAKDEKSGPSCAEQTPTMGDDNGSSPTQQSREVFESPICRLAGDIIDMIDGLSRHREPLEDFIERHSAEHQNEAGSTSPSASPILATHEGASSAPLPLPLPPPPSSSSSSSAQSRDIRLCDLPEIEREIDRLSCTVNHHKQEALAALAAQPYLVSTLCRFKDACVGLSKV